MKLTAPASDLVIIETHSDSPTSSVKPPTPIRLGTRGMGSDHRPCGARQCRQCAARADWHHGAWYALKRSAGVLLEAQLLDEVTASGLALEAQWHRSRALAYENGCATGLARLSDLEPQLV